MKNKKNTNIISNKLTICIPTCYGEKTLIDAVKSIRSSGGNAVGILVLADSIPLSEKIKANLRKLNVEFKENKTPSSQISKIKLLLTMVKTEYVVFTQDDITISKESIKNILSFLEINKNITMFTVFNETTKPHGYIDYSLLGGVLVDRYLEKNWNNGQNFLNGDGRFLGFKTKFMKKFKIPEQIINVDTYLYFENKRRQGSFERCNSAIVYYTLPNSIREQIKKSSRYQYYAEEMSSYFPGIENELKIPTSLMIKGLIYGFWNKPLNMLCYFPLLMITRIIHEDKSKTKNAIWDVDISTK